MPAPHLFLSHSTRDEAVVAELRNALESCGLSIWADSRRLSGGDPLEPIICAAIDGARHFLALLSPHAINSPWVRKEIQYALSVQKTRSDGFKVIPLLLPGIEPAALPLWFEQEPVAVHLSLGPGGISEALPELLAALGEQSPNDRAMPKTRPTPPIFDLILELTDPGLDVSGGKRRATAIARLILKPPNAPEVESKRYRFTAPLGPIETEDLSWYLERYCHWPSGVFQEQARPFVCCWSARDRRMSSPPTSIIASVLAP